MSQVFALPDLGEGLTEADIVEWLVAEGEQVAIDQPVVVVETAKATLDVPCPFAGRLERQHGRVGESVAVGAPLITVTGEEGSGAVLIGYGTTDTAGAPTSSRAARRARLRTNVDRVGNPAGRAETAAIRVISPIVRRLARERGIDLEALSSRLGGRVLRRADLEEAVTSAGLETTSTIHPRRIETAGDDEHIPLTGLRGAIAEHLTTSRREIPDATTWVDVDATALLEAKHALRQAHPDARIGLLPLLARICVAALQRYPELNARVDTEAREIVRHRTINLGVAAQSPRGLVVPVVHGAEAMTTRELTDALRALTERARAGSLTPRELTGGTFTLNNYGVFGVDGSTPILNHPEAAMVGLGRIIERPWVVDHELVIRQVTQIGLTFDHRVCDGGSAGGFLRAVADGVERPIALLADL